MKRGRVEIQNILEGMNSRSFKTIPEDHLEGSGAFTLFFGVICWSRPIRDSTVTSGLLFCHFSSFHCQFQSTYRPHYSLRAPGASPPFYFPGFCDLRTRDTPPYSPYRIQFLLEDDGNNYELHPRITYIKHIFYRLENCLFLPISEKSFPILTGLFWVTQCFFCFWNSFVSSCSVTFFFVISKVNFVSSSASFGYLFNA